MQKRGLSDIVSTVLIILVVLVAIGIIWFFLNPFVGETSKVSSAQACIQVQTSSISCTYSDARISTFDPSNWFATVQVRRGPDNAMNVSDMRLVFYDQNITIKSSIIDWSAKIMGESLPNPYETTQAGFYIGVGKPEPNSVAVAPMVNKEKRVCSLSPTIPCNKYAYVPGTGCADLNNDTFVDSADFPIIFNCFDTYLKGGTCLGAENVTKLYNSTSGQWYDNYTYDAIINPKRLDGDHNGILNFDDPHILVSAFAHGDGANEVNCPD